MSGPLGSAQWMYASGAAVTQQSLKFNDDESQYLSWTPAAAGNRKTWTWSGWVKRGNLTGADQFIFSGNNGSTNFSSFYFNNSNNLAYYDYVSGTVNSAITSAVFRDTSAWYHIVLYYDTTQATSTDRIKIYVNGEQQSVSASYPSLNYDSFINSSSYTNYLASQTGGASYLDGYLSDVYFIDGQALDPTDFGQFTNGYWEKIDYAGTYNTNGFHLTFQDDVVSEGFNVATWRGNSPLSQSISGLGLSPDLVWIKSRSQTYNHVLADTVRGQGKDLYSNTTAAESSSSTELISFDADGFSVGSGGSANDPTGSLGFVAWCWDAGSGSAASNTDGSITSTVKANPSYGFSIVSYTGTGANATVGHGIATPDMIIVKGRNTTAAQAWRVYHKDSNASPASGVLNLNTDGAFVSSSTQWNNTAPTSSVFSVGTDPAVNENTKNYIAYCFAEVAGYSSIGSYSGSGAAGNAVTTGFAPAFVMVKRTDSSGTWVMFDTTRSPTNTADNALNADLSDREYTSADGVIGIDFDANGFTLQDDHSTRNASGGTYIYMAFADTREAAFWKDVSGQGNHWTPNNLDYRDSLIDSPANNFAVMNPLLDTTGNITFSEGNLKTVDTNASTSGSAIAVNSGKWFAEMVCTAKTASNAMVGICTVDGFDSDRQLDESLIGGSGHGYVMNATKLPGGAAYGATWAIGDVIGIALDLDSAQNTVTFYKNGSSQGAININNAEYVFCNSNGQGSSTVTYVSNFGQDSTFSGARPAGGNVDDNGIGDFAYSVPAGFLSLCSASLPTPSIVDGSTAFSTVLYTGDGATSHAITGVGFGSAPDFVWVKERTTAQNHNLFDSVRGAGNNKGLISDNTSAEGTDSVNYGYISSFDSDGFTLAKGADATFGSARMNDTGAAYVAWNWKAGGTAVANTDGSITSQVSANVDAGFSIVSYTGNGTSGATIGHSLGVKPDMIIFKDRDSAQTWTTYHSSLGATKLIFLNRTDAFYTEPWLNNTEPTSSVITLSTYSDVNTSGDNYIAYCFHSVDGYSKAGSYTGNGSAADGPFVYTGFRPAWIMVKNASVSNSWRLWDSERPGYNLTNLYLTPDSSGSEGAINIDVDLTSNGFKLRGSNSSINGSGNTIIYLAFAETPFKYANAR